MAPSTEQLINRIREHSSALQEQFGVRRLRLFGSWARGAAGPQSDVDVLVEFAAPANARRFYGLQFYLEDLLGRSVDLVSEKALRAELRSSVEADAITI
ncbi:nucleotidyltransferase family protein [Vulcanococcus sp.]|jgi:predicted nucleotidyltransferase|uniref:nucleotidyltransferase family protein n=1 Tax=Vulcanococcus sp. TaxID=2856995 RepID=UPI0037DA2A92